MRVQIAVQFALLLVLLPVTWAEKEGMRHAVHFFGGVQLDNAWIDVVKRPKKINPTRGRFVGVAASRRLKPWGDSGWFELEGQVVRHVRAQQNFEFNVAPVVRWTPIRLNRFVQAGVAFGMGLSHTTEKPTLERKYEGETARTMVYWVFEMTAGPPNSPWDGVMRLHHRSPGYGLFAGDGGYNGLVLGLRRWF